MSSVVRLKVPPFEPAAPTSLAALRRPLITPDHSHCDSHCQPCSVCEAKQVKAVEAAKKLSQDTALRMSQLIEDALATHIARIETEQANLVTAVLKAVLPHLNDSALRSALTEEISRAAESMRDPRFTIAKSPDLDLGELNADSRITLEDDPRLSGHHVELRRDGGATHIDPEPLIAACLARLNPTPVRD